MSARRDLIRGMLSAVTAEDVEKASVSDCQNVSQINVFSGGSVNINLSAYVNSEMLTDEERAVFYRKCHGIAKQYAIYPQMRKYMKAEWGARSMRSLNDTALRSLLRFLRGLESAIVSRQCPLNKSEHGNGLQTA